MCTTEAIQDRLSPRTLASRQTCAYVSGSRSASISTYSVTVNPASGAISSSAAVRHASFPDQLAEDLTGYHAERTGQVGQSSIVACAS